MTGTTANPEYTYVLIIHEVADYARWKDVFDGAAEMRRNAGEIEYQVLASEANATLIVHFSRWSSLDAARAFFDSAELVEIRRVAGVRAPDFLFLNEIEAKSLAHVGHVADRKERC